MAISNSSALLKTILHKSLAEGVYRDVVTRASNYYYFLGQTLGWTDELNPPYPLDSYKYELDVRNEIITMKLITPTDVAFVIPRRDWQQDFTYDQFDDSYSTEIIGLDVQNGGAGYTSLPTITVTGGGGTGANFSPVVLDGAIIGIDVWNKGQGYITEPTVTVTGGGGSGAVLKAVIRSTPNAVQKLEDTNYYVMTEDYNVYKCLDNNNGALSTIKPIGTQVTPIYTSDGYTWKFMYNVPIALRNKFMSDEYIPVVSALTNQFYSNGSLENILINNKGESYQEARIVVVGDGFLESDPTFIEDILMSNVGSAYTTPTVTISDPVSDATLFIPTAAVQIGQRIYTNAGHFYEVASPGTMSAIAPSHKIGTVSNGTAALKFVGTRASGTATVVNGEITGITLDGAVRSIDMVIGGEGYITVPNVYITGGGGSNASAVAKVIDGVVRYIDLTNSGDNYTSIPTIKIGDEWQAGLSVLIGEQYFYSGRLYTVTSDGTFDAGSGNYPVHLSGSATNGTAVLTHAGVNATATAKRRFGAGYKSAPIVNITDSPGSNGVDADAYFQTSKSEARMTPILDNGQIVGIIFQDPGVGYSTATLTVTGDGDGAELQADLNVGTIQSLQANNEILTIKGTINSIQVISGGYGYGVANIRIEGDGSGATAEADIDTTSGRITRIRVTDVGQDYTYAIIHITGNGHAGTARGVIAPYGGHGRNSPDELFARTLMFYANVSTDLNQGIAVNNDYRQIGIIKNPRVYDDDIRFKEALGSTCYVIEPSGTFDQSKFPRDSAISLNRLENGEISNKKYRVISTTSNSILIQSLNNDIPSINDTWQNDEQAAEINGATFTATSVGLPQVDKYSGQMMFIDNKAGFTPSADETVTLRTVLKF